MRKYYLFKIKENNLNLSSINLYNFLEELYYLNTNKFKYGMHIFNDLCSDINENLLELLKEKYDFKDNKIIINDLENTIVDIKHTMIVIETDKNAPSIFKYINALEKNLFVCDFNNKDFFWLNEFVRLNLKISI